MRHFTWLILVFLAFLVGCGGGGGANTPTFIYVTQWNTPTGGVDGQSQRVQLFDQNNILRFSAVFDKPATSTHFFGVPHGVYHLHVDLFAQIGEQGSLNGVLDDQVTITAPITYQSTVGPAITTVRLSPTSATIKTQHSQQFYATAEAASTVPTFDVPNGFTWQTLGGVASVDQNGLVIGTSPGPGSVKATETASSSSGSASLTVQLETAIHAKWTVIVFMNAANNLYAYSTLNMNQMEMVAQNPDVRFVVQWKQSTGLFPSSTFNGTRRYLVQPDTTNAIASELIQDLGPDYDMGSAANLLDFITWAKTNYPADRYCVVMWDHGNGWKRSPFGTTRGVSYDDESGNHIDTWEMSQALGNGVNDILAWDASLMQQLEVAEEVRDKAHYIVGSEESPPAAGYPYDTIFAHFRDNPDDTTLNLAKNFVDETLLVPGYAGEKITQSVIDPTQLPGLVTSTSSLADVLIANVGSLGTIVPQVRANAQQYSDNSVNGHYRDLFDVGLKLENFSAPSAVITAEQAVRTAIGQAVVYEGHNSNSPSSHGISIDFSSSTQFAPLAIDYQNLRFGQETHWGQWLSVAP